MKDIDEGYTGEAILHVVYYGVDITLVYFSAVWSCFFWRSSFFSAVRFSIYLAVWIWLYVQVRPNLMIPKPTQQV